MLHKDAMLEEGGEEGGEEEECGSEREDYEHDDKDGYENDYDDDDDDDEGDGGDGGGDEGERWELSVRVSMRSEWRRRMAQSGVHYHLQAEVSTRRGVTSTERFVGCRYRHAASACSGRVASISSLVAMATLLVTLLVLVLALVCTVRDRRSPGNRPGERRLHRC
ncbi:uncharacterized protein LOC133361994 [Lethenteron reissneri]|uniref:uncharacterized protein LOC133361994 n=1 Tax=Lethenteron reissneri TaxID=7753 RepID=UPI002AB69927|nr:uncharacterized protein LOC133361994 [Lethenteron reissneri]